MLDDLKKSLLATADKLRANMDSANYIRDIRIAASVAEPQSDASGKQSYTQDAP